MSETQEVLQPVAHACMPACHGAACAGGQCMRDPLHCLSHALPVAPAPRARAPAPRCAATPSAARCICGACRERARCRAGAGRTDCTPAARPASGRPGTRCRPACARGLRRAELLGRLRGAALPGVCFGMPPASDPPLAVTGAGACRRVLTRCALRGCARIRQQLLQHRQRARRARGRVVSAGRPCRADRGGTGGHAGAHDQAQSDQSSQVRRMRVRGRRGAPPLHICRQRSSSGVTRSASRASHRRSTSGASASAPTSSSAKYARIAQSTLSRALHHASPAVLLSRAAHSARHAVW